jgi:hypothetical protein
MLARKLIAQKESPAAGGARSTSNCRPRKATRGGYSTGRAATNLFRCSATTSRGRVTTGRTTMDASRFFGIDAIEWSVTLTGSVLLALTAWMM